MINLLILIQSTLFFLRFELFILVCVDFCDYKMDLINARPFNNIVVFGIKRGREDAVDHWWSDEHF